METGKSSSSAAVEDAKRRCTALSNRLLRLSSSSSSSSKNSLNSATSPLLRLINSELSFLHRLSLTPSPPSFNVGHLEAVAHVLRQPFVTGVSRVCKAIALSPSISVYVDIVCSINGNPVWFIVSDRNPRYITWEGSLDDVKSENKGLKRRVELVLDAAREAPVALRPSSVVLFFANGVDDGVCGRIRDEFGSVEFGMVEGFEYEEVELDGEWMDVVVVGRSFLNARAFEIAVEKGDGGMEGKRVLGCVGVGEVGCCKKYDGYCDLKLGSSLRALVCVMKCWCCALDGSVGLGLQKGSFDSVGVEMVNFDTTAMVAIVSGISNGGIERLLAMPENELRGRFKGNYGFVIAQIDSENQNPILEELSAVLSGKRGIISESVHSEFQELIAMCGGPNEKLRAQYILKFLKVVPDCPSTRMVSLPTTRKLALKNKVVFGTGDYWSAPTVTANMAFVRAVAQTGMSLSVIEHRPRALVGD